jgi:hypothetical protein
MAVRSTHSCFRGVHFENDKECKMSSELKKKKNGAARKENDVKSRICEFVEGLLCVYSSLFYQMTLLFYETSKICGGFFYFLIIVRTRVSRVLSIMRLFTPIANIRCPFL